MKENILKKQFAKKDVKRLRNIISGKSNERTGAGIGYTKNQEFHNEGDVWEENDQKGTYGGSSGLSLRSPVAYLDSPNTTSAVTYQFMVYTDGNSTVNFNTNAPSYVTIMEVTV